MSRKKLDVVEVKAALAIVRDSEKLIMGLKVSINSLSSEMSVMQDGLDQYLKTKKREFQFRLFSIECKMALKKFVSIILAFIG